MAVAVAVVVIIAVDLDIWPGTVIRIMVAAVVVGMAVAIPVGSLGTWLETVSAVAAEVAAAVVVEPVLAVENRGT